MTALLLSVHVLAAIVLIGPIAVAASLFPRYARSEPDSGAPRLLHRICRGYALAGLAVPVFGLATALQMGVLADPWLLISIALTLIAAGLLALVILPAQSAMLTEPVAATAKRLTTTTGIFNLIWAAVVVLMIVRPGSSTGV
ncbi:hypothetical protein [Saccharopolyspora tripterygii]